MSEQCWCGHVKASHRSWAAGLFCSNVGCGCRHYSKKGAPPPEPVAAPRAEGLEPALAYALARADLPTDMETSRDYAGRLAPLVIESGWLSRPSDEREEAAFSDADIEALVAEEAPNFRRLGPALKRHRFTIAGHVTEHERHRLTNVWHSTCDGCRREAPKGPFG